MHDTPIQTLLTLRRQLPSPDERRARRERARISRRRLGQEVGVSGLTISRWEDGHEPASVLHLQRYVAILEVLAA